MLRIPLEPVEAPAIGVQQPLFNVNDSPSMRKLAWDEIDRPNPEKLANLPRHPVSVVAHNIRSITWGRCFVRAMRRASSICI